VTHMLGGAARAAVARVATVGVGAALALTGCAGQPGSAPPPAAAPAEPAPPTREWAAQLCRTLDPVYGTLGSPPDVDLADGAATLSAYRAHLAEVESAAQQAVDGVGTLGTPPVDNGGQAVADLRQQLADLGRDAARTRGLLEQVDPADPLAVEQAAGSVVNGLGTLGNDPQLLDILGNYPQLDEAVQEAPECDGLALPTASATPAAPSAQTR
jgi:hypothetical protein